MTLISVRGHVRRARPVRPHVRGFRHHYLVPGPQRTVRYPIRVGAVGFPSIAYNSHGSWSTVGEIRALEIGRDNVHDYLDGFADNLSAIWVTRTPREALGYLELAENWDRLHDLSKPLRKSDLSLMKEISRVNILPTDVIATEDGDGGFLIVRKASGD